MLLLLRLKKQQKLLQLRLLRLRNKLLPDLKKRLRRRRRRHLHLHKLHKLLLQMLLQLLLLLLLLLLPWYAP